MLFRSQRGFHYLVLRRSFWQLAGPGRRLLNLTLPLSSFCCKTLLSAGRSSIRTRAYAFFGRFRLAGKFDFQNTDCTVEEMRSARGEEPTDGEEDYGYAGY